MMVPVALLLVYFESLAGPIRYALTLVGGTAAMYVPAVIGMLALTSIVFMKFLSRNLTKFEIASLAIFGFGLFYSLILMNMPFIQIAMYTYIIYPIFIGIFSPDAVYHAIRKHSLILWGIAVSGVFLNYFISFPWTGLEYSIEGIERSLSKESLTFGLDRLAGFSRSNFDVSFQITFYSSMLFYNKSIRKIFLISIYLISIFAIWLTTTKSALLGLAAIGPVLMALALLGKKQFKTKTWFLVASLLFISGIVILVPTWFSILNKIEISSNYTSFMFINADTLIDRINYTWPMAIDLIRADYQALEWIFGRGIGGIGATAKVVSVDYYNPADNLFVYLYVTCGLLSLVIIAGLIQGSINIVKREKELTALLIAIMFMALGLTSSMIEAIIPELFLGILLGGLNSIKKDSEEVPDGGLPFGSNQTGPRV